MKIKNFLLKNWQFKLLAIFFAFVTWFLVIQVTDPIATRTLQIPIEFLNEEIITGRGQTVEVIGDKTVSVTVKASRSIRNALTEEDFSAVADYAEMYRDSQVPIVVKSLNKKVSSSDFEQGKASVEVKLEDIETISRVIEYTLTGKPANGYIVGDVKIEPETIEISCPKSMIPYFKTVRVMLDVTDLSDDQEVKANLHIYDGNGDEIKVEENDKVSWNGDGIVTCHIEAIQVQTVSVKFTAADIENTAAGYVFTGLSSNKDSITLCGRKSDISKISVVNIPVSVKNVSSSETRIIDVRNFIPENIDVYEDDPEFEVKISVEKTEEKAFVIEPSLVEIKGLAEGLTAKVNSPLGITVKVKGRTSVLNGVSADDIKLSVDATGLDAGNHNVKLVISLPEGDLVSSSDIQLVLITITGPEEPTE